MSTILVIDDNETIREGLAHVVKKMGHLPLVAKNGKEGVERFKPGTEGNVYLERDGARG